MLISKDPSLLDLALIHRFLSTESTWARNIAFDIVEKSIQHSLCFGMYENQQQIAFARVVTDYATFAYLADVFVVPEYRGRGLSKLLMEFVLAQEELLSLRRFLLASSNARGLYQQFGFTPLGKPEIFLEIARPDIYQPKIR